MSPLVDKHEVLAILGWYALPGLFVSLDKDSDTFTCSNTNVVDILVVAASQHRGASVAEGPP